jgi:uncharacterized metal-binding protein YceD (DUF177 family)
MLNYPALILKSRNTHPFTKLTNAMTKIETPESSALQFSRPIEVARLKGTIGQDFDLAPDAAEINDLTVLFAANRLSKVRFKGTIRPFGKSEWEMSGHLGATVVQPCVVTLAPVTTRIETDVHRLFVREIIVGEDVEIDPEDDVDLELLGPIIDLGLIATEELALAIPEYPRAPGADLESVIGDQLGDAAKSDKPFDALKSLRDRLSDG